MQKGIVLTGLHRIRSGQVSDQRIASNWNLVDAFQAGKSTFLWFATKVLYGRLLKISAIPFLRTFPVIRGRNGTARLGPGARILGTLEIIFSDPAHAGVLDIGGGFRSENGVTLAPRGGAIQMGRNVFVGKGTLIQAISGSAVTIGDDVMIANGVTIVASNHSIADASLPMASQPEHGVGINIGSDVWIAANVVVTDGVRVGNGSVIGAGAVVTRDVPVNAIMAGIPARQIGARSASREQA